MSTALVVSGGELDHYIAEVSRYPLLSREEEVALARRYRDLGEVAAAHKLVVSHLRFVVKVAYAYRGYGIDLLELVQEGNIGLMQAVKKFDPERGYRLISYAVWWVKAHIQAFLLRSWSLVRVGSGRARRKLFFKVRSAKSQLEQEHGQQGTDSSELASELALRLGVSEVDAGDMEVRMAARDFSLDAPLADDSSSTHLDRVMESGSNPEDRILAAERRTLVGKVLDDVAEQLNDKERYILEARLLNDEPPTLAEIGDHFGVSRERIRQLEERVLKKLKVAIAERAPDLAAA